MDYIIKRKEAIKLRKLAKSYKEISETLGIPKSTLSGWFSKVPWSDDVKKKLVKSISSIHGARIKKMNAVRMDNLNKHYIEARKIAGKELENNINNSLFMFGLALYWGEGDKVTKYQLRLTNSDPEVIRSFKIFLDRFCNGKNEKIWAGLLLYQDLDSDICINHWSKAIGLDKKCFTKSVIIKGRHKTNKLNYGICILGISSRFLKEKMLEWLRLVPNYIK